MNTEEGWIKYNNMEYRVLATEPWYLEERCTTGDRKISLSRFSTMAMYYGTFCKTYGIEYSISTLRPMAIAFRGQDVTSENGWIKFTSDQIERWIYATPEFVIKYKNVTISNEFYEKDFFKDFFLRICSNWNSGIVLSCWRQEVQYEHVKYGYMHSHVQRFSYENSHDVSGFCTGSHGNSTNQGISHAYSAVDRAQKAMNSILNNEDISPEILRNLNDFEYHMSMLTGALLPLIKTESIEGVPHIMMRYAYMSGDWEIAQTEDGAEQDIPGNDYIVKMFKDFAKCVCENIHDKRITYRIHGDSVQITPNRNLAAFAKEHGFFEKCFAFQGKVGADYDVPATAKPTLSAKEIREIDHKMMWHTSPFYWNGEVLRAKAIHLQNTFQINESEARIHEDYAYHFHNAVKGYFKERLITFGRNPQQVERADLCVQTTGAPTGINIGQGGAENNETAQSA